MNYELALELKNAGFPQHELCNNECTTDGDIGVNMCFPTLSELVDACGEDFVNISRLAHTNPQKDQQRFFAEGKITKSKLMRHYADTPEEAVAKLWLAINKK